MRFGVLALVIWLFGTARLWAVDAPLPTELDRWVEQLDADEFLVRKEATGQLIAAGQSSVDLVSQAVAAGSREVVARGVYVLRELALSDQSETEVAAMLALEDLATVRTDVPGYAGPATKALEYVLALRQEEALSRLQSAGATVNVMRFPNGLFPAGGRFERASRLIIDEKWKGDLDDLDQLRYVVECQVIVLSGRHVANEWMKSVVKMRGLRSIEMTSTSVDDDGIAQLLDATQLQTLGVYYSPVSDKSMTTLSQASQLIKVVFDGTDVTAAGIERLRKAIPGLDIEFRRGGFLGVGESQRARPNDTEGFRIGEVQAKSAAEKAGIREGDVILKFNGEEVTDFPSLKSLIGQNRVGDEVSLKLMRNGEPFDVTVRLGSRAR